MRSFNTSFFKFLFGFLLITAASLFLLHLSTGYPSDSITANTAQAQ